MNEFWGYWWEDGATRRSRDETQERDREQVEQRGTMSAKPAEIAHAMPTGQREAMAMQARFGNHAVGQMVMAAARTHGDLDPGVMPAPLCGKGGGTSHQDHAPGKPGVVEPLFNPKHTKTEAPARTLEPEPDPPVPGEPVVAPAPVRTSEQVIAEVDDKARSRTLGAFLSVLPAKPGAAPWDALAAAFDNAPRRIADQAAQAISAVILNLGATDRKRIDIRLAAAERGGRPPLLIELIRARLNTVIPAVVEASVPPQDP